MPSPVALAWDLIAKDNASPAFLRAAASADKAATATVRATAKIDAASASMRNAGAKLTKGLTVPLIALGAVAVSQAAKFQQATNVYVTAAGESQKNLAVVRDGIKRVAVETGTSIKNLTDAEYLAEKAHLRGAAGIKVLSAAAKGAREENANLADVMQAMTSIMASYHLNASKSVAVMNALKTGAGSAKVTMEQYSRSLSTVIPVASAAGIGLDQLLGALSTLTQHGTTADEATQELANTIRNLQAPNNVAVSAMNQLGIASVNVAKNLGKRGLTGTLEYIESKLPKTGLVYLTTMKRMEAGTKDLTAMQSKMSPSLLKLSKGFLDGSVTMKEYRRAYKGLGADGYAQGAAFLRLAARVRGYNDNIKSGTPAQKTMAAELKAIFGGATGLNTVLQLGGHNLAGFKKRTDEVGKSLHDTTGDVEGWASTQKLASVQADIAKEKLHVLAIEAGAVLLPVFNKLVGGVSSAVTWFGKLSHSDKALIGWSLVALAALGPVLSIIGNLMRAFTLLIGLGSKIVGFGATIVGTFTAVEASSVELTSAEAINAAAFATVEAEKAAATAEAAVAIAASMEGTSSVLAGEAAAAALAAIEFSAAMTEEAAAAVASAETITAASEEAGTASSLALGPIGIAIGAVVGVGALAAHALGLFGGSAKKAVGPEDDLTAAILRNNGALGTNVRAIVASKFANDGAYTSALKLGISIKTLTDAALGHKDAMAKVNAMTTITNYEREHASGRANDFATNDMKNKIKVAAAIGHETAAVKASIVAAKQEAEAESTAGKTATARAKALKQVTNLQTAATKSLQGLNVQVGTHGNSVEASTTALHAMIQASNKVAVAQFNSGSSIGSVTSKLATNIAAFRAQAVQAGFNGKAIDALTKKYELTPKQIVTKLIADTSKATASASQLQHDIDAIRQNKIPGLSANSAKGRAIIAAMQARIDALHGKTIIIPVIPDFSKLPSTYKMPAGAVTGGGPHGNGHAAGGTVYGGGTGTSDSVPIMASTGEEIINAKQADKHRALLKAINSGAPGFAGGGTVGGKANATLGARIIGKDTTGLMAAIGKTVDQIKSAFATIIADLKKAGYSPSALKSITSRSDALLTKQAKLSAELGVQSTSGTTALDRLSTAMQTFNDKASSVASAVTGTFDINATPGDPRAALNAMRAANGLGALKSDPFGLIMSSLGGDVNNAKSFRSGLAKLKGEGLSTSLYDQLASAGPSSLTNVKALLSASPKDIGRLSAQYGQLAGIGAATGHDVAKVVNGAALTHDREVVKELRAAQAENTRLLKQLIAATTRVGGDVGAHLGGATSHGVLKARTTPAGHR